MRIARNFGQRYGLKSCIRHDSNERGMQYGHRDKLSYLWTFVRDPTHRAMSAIGKKLSNQLLKSNSRDSFTGDGMAEFNKTILVDKTLDLLQHATDVRDAVLSEGRGGFQFQFVLQQYIPANDVNDPLHPGEIADPDVLALKVSRVSVCLLYCSQCETVLFVLYTSFQCRVTIFSPNTRRFENTTLLECK